MVKQYINIYILFIYSIYVKTKDEEDDKDNTIFQEEPIIPILIYFYIEAYNTRNIKILSKLKEIDYTIKLNRNNPLYSLIYSLSNQELGKLQNYLDNTIEKGWIYYLTLSTSAPILFVLNKDSRLRLYIDYRGLNKVTIKNYYLLSLISKILNRLLGTKVLSKISIKDTYYYIRIKKGNKQKTAFYI